MAAERAGDERILEQLPVTLKKLMCFERHQLYRAARFQSDGDDGFDRKFLPQNCGAIRLQCFWVRREYLFVYGENNRCSEEIGIFSDGGRNQRVLFPIHPTSLDHYRVFLAQAGAEDAGVCIWAVPTASTRTLLAWPDKEPHKAVFFKTTLRSSILGDRRLYRRKVEASVGLSMLMDASFEILPPEFAYFPESTGLVPRTLQDSGLIVRSIPNEIKDGSILLSPLFALLGGSGSYTPLLITLVRKWGVDPLELVQAILCAPFARLWLNLTLKMGLILEAHGQDLLLAMSPTMEPLRRFYYRDFEGLRIDWELRRRRGLRAPDNMPGAWHWYDAYEAWGYPGSQLMLYKLHISLGHYLGFLRNVEEELRVWHRRGLVRGRRVRAGEITLLFISTLFKEIDEMFGVHIAGSENANFNLSAIIRSLMKVRMEVFSRV